MNPSRAAWLMTRLLGPIARRDPVPRLRWWLENQYRPTSHRPSRRSR